MSEWQPARFIGAHFSSEDAAAYREGLELREGNPLIHIRPTKPTVWNVTFYRTRGCDALRYFEVQEEPGAIVCEHEILTD